MSYKIGSFNMYKFQAYLSDEEHKKEINKIAQIIEDEQFSVMALQEIFSKQAMEMLLKRLGISWAKQDPDYKNNAEIKWNFTKFLVNRNGEVVERFESTTEPAEIADKILSLL